MRFLREIIGHRPVIRTLLNTVASGRVAHAYLFTGPEGVGKETVALAFARALLCSRPVDGDACGLCRECRQVEHHNHPDLCVLQPDGNTIKIEQIRGILRRAPYRSYQGGRKIFLIPGAEAMTAEAANCLLKTLEEPPGDTLFILLSARPHALLPTVLSRCQRCAFQAIPAPELAEGLAALYGFSEEEAHLPALLAGGSMGKALACISGSTGDARAEAGLLALSLGRAGPLEALDLAEKTAESRDRALCILETLICWYRDLLIWLESGETGFLYNPDRSEEIRREAGSYDARRLVTIIEAIGAAKNKIEANANTRLVLEALFLRLAGLVAPV
ncbi:MAG TPA: DNA polymerase III subunit delta' [Peptococcaceae bacterium]|jgi:DNA polymerase-3 subunit delta'|nr:DNA polymerase III subunit delta' [Bacillota bacterium]HHU86154.1 DNA polymerase III subunit delta' [Peptococcaceae bacterium]